MTLRLLLVLALAGCAAQKPLPPPEVRVVPVFIDNLQRCTLPCAPFPVLFACQAPGRLKCQCADGETWDVDLATP